MFSIPIHDEANHAQTGMHLDFQEGNIPYQGRFKKVFHTEDLFPLLRGDKERERLPWKPECSYFLTRTNDALEIKLSFFESQESYLSQFPLESLKAAATDRLYELMDGVPLKAIRVCRECEKTFVQVKGKKREFCEDRCMNRWHSRKRRQDDPEGYRAKQREIMSKRYEAKQKKEIGPNVKLTKQRRK